MTHTTPQVKNGVLVYDDGTQVQTITVGTAAWYHWLGDAHTTTFRVTHPQGSFTARKEGRQRGGRYWSAYRTRDRRLRKAYLGRVEELTPQRLGEVALRLSDAQPAPPRDRTAGHTEEQPPPHPGGAHAAGVPQDTLLATKLFRPLPRRDVVRRGRLTERLSGGLRGPLTLVIAPAGWGKTTLLSEWCASCADTHTPVAWLTLERGDNDLARFLRYLIAALQMLDATMGVAALAGLRSPHPPVDTLLTLLLNDLATLPEESILLLDDYHLIEDPTIHRALTFLLDHLPPQVHLVIAARVDPPLPLARLRARGQLTELRAQDLRFGPDEASAFLLRTMGLPLAAEEVAQLETCTEGWIAGLQLAALSLQGRDVTLLPAAITAVSGTHRYILDYLAAEVFQRQPADIRHFLLRTSVLDRMTGPLCDALAGATDVSGGAGQAMLERLEASDLFLVTLDADRTWYRYHHLFADFLRDRLQREHRAVVPDLHRRACAWYEQRGLLTEAIDHALAAPDHTRAARLVEQAMPLLLWQRGELATLRRWLDRLPREAARVRPRLCLDLAWVLLWSGQLAAVEARLQDAEQALALGDTATTPVTTDQGASRRTLRGEIAAMRAEIARQHGDLAALSLAQQALAELPAEERLLRGLATGVLATAYLWSGNAAAASQAFAETVARGAAAETSTLELFASGRLVQARAVQGRLHQAAAAYQQTLDLAATYGVPASPAIGVAQVGMADVLREWNELDAAEDLARQGIARCVEAGGLADMALDGHLTLARILQARGDSAGVRAALRQAAFMGDDGPSAQASGRVAAACARLQLISAEGDSAAALGWAAEHVGAWRTDEPLSYVALLERLTLARLRLEQGQRDDAATLLARLLTIVEEGGVMSCAIEILVLQARLLQETAQEAQAMLTLSRALALAEPEGYIRLFVEEGVPMIGLLRKAQARGVRPPYVATLLAARGSAPQMQPPVAAALVEPLSGRELALLRLLAAGLSTPEIAVQLSITVDTVRSHLKTISRKLDVHTRLQAVQRARTLGLV